MKLLKKVYDKFVKKPTEWIEIKIPKLKVPKFRREEEEEKGKEEE